MKSGNSCRILWQQNTDGSASVFRMYGEFPQIRVPGEIAGHPVTEIAPYCFAQVSHLPEKLLREEVGTENIRFPEALQELCGNAVEEVILPDSIHTIGNCAFYNCRNLKSLTIGAQTEHIGSDAFMNTISFHRIRLLYPADTKSGLKQILSQISADMEVSFINGEKTEAVLLYPEYYESYDEIAPAHIFGRSITGEGFRARQCIKDGKVDFAGYDAVFPQACVEESEATLSEMALNRLLYPYALQEKNREMYQQYIREHSKTIAIRLTEMKKIKILQFLCQDGIISDTELAECVLKAADMDWAEGTAVLLQQQASMRKERKKKRYDLDAL